MKNHVMQTKNVPLIQLRKQTPISALIACLLQLQHYDFMNCRNRKMGQFRAEMDID